MGRRRRAGGGGRDGDRGVRADDGPHGAQEADERGVPEDVGGATDAAPAEVGAGAGVFMRSIFVRGGTVGKCLGLDTRREYGWMVAGCEGLFCVWRWVGIEERG